MKRQRQASEEKGPKVPGYIVTYSDMATLLLTFFVLLLTLADVQDPELFDKGRDSFLESLRYVGLGALFGRQKMPTNLGELKTKYYIPDPEQTSTNRMIDAKAEELRRTLEDIKQSATVIPSKIDADKVHFSITNVRFLPGQANLDEQAMKFLTEFCQDLQQSIGSESGMLYVLGLAAEEKDEKQQWFLSARRAQVVARFLQDHLDTEEYLQGQQYQGISESTSTSKWSVYSWGAGAGGDWVGPDSTMSDLSQILIAVLRKDG